MHKSASKDRIREQLELEVSRPEFQSQYEDLQRFSPPLQPYHSAGTLLSFLWDFTIKDYTAKDSCLHSLIRVFHVQDHFRCAALRLLLLAMWPGLDHLYHQLIHFSKESSDLFADIYWRFIKEVEEWNLQKTNKIAINLQMNTGKRIRKVHECERRLLRFRDEGEEQTAIIYQQQSWGLLRKEEYPLENPIKKVKELLKKGVIKEEEYSLVIKHLVCRVPLKILADERSLTYKAVCKRYERIILKIRTRFAS